jgi:hypothetical protein
MFPPWAKKQAYLTPHLGGKLQRGIIWKILYTIDVHMFEPWSDNLSVSGSGSFLAGVDAHFF